MTMNYKENTQDYKTKVESLFQHEPAFISYFHQISEIIKSNPKTLLEIGVGVGIPKLIVKNLFDIEYHTFDCNEKLNPDFVGTVTELPFSDNSYDLVCCFEVLEHLPFSDFEKSLSEIFRVASNTVIISLPNNPPTLNIEIARKFKLLFWQLPLWKCRVSKEHHWEINTKDYPLKKILKIIKKIGEQYGFTLKKNYRLFNNPYHHFFIMEK